MRRTSDRDREIVRTHLRHHLPSGFPVEPGPIRVGDVACRVRADYASGREQLRDVDAALSNHPALLTDPTPLEGRMTPKKIREATAHLDLALTEHYLERFRRAAVEMLLARHGGSAVSIACERAE